MRPELTTDELLINLNHADVFDRLSDREQTYIRNAFLDEESHTLYDDVLGPEPLTRIRQWRNVAAQARNERIERTVIERAGMGQTIAA